MQKYENIANEIVEYLESNKAKFTTYPRGRSVFVICGPSGSGKTRSIDIADEHFPDDKGIAESYDIIGCKDAAEAIKFIKEDESEFERSEHIAYSLIDTATGIAITQMDKNIKVIFVPEK